MGQNECNIEIQFDDQQFTRHQHTHTHRNIQTKKNNDKCKKSFREKKLFKIKLKSVKKELKVQEENFSQFLMKSPESFDKK